MRPVLTPAVRRLWRDRETLQLGRPPGPAVVLAGVDPGVRAALALLDGTRDRATVLQTADDAGCSPVQADRLLSLLDDAGLLEDAALRPAAGHDRGERDRAAPDRLALRLFRGPHAAQAARRRQAASVVVEGCGRVGAALAGLLAASGVGAVEPVDAAATRPEDCGFGGLPAAGIGRPRGDVVRELMAATSPSVRSTRRGLPDLVVLAPAPGEPLADPPRLLPHLVVQVLGAVGVVGPLVTPGASACLRCLDLARTDRDPGWPAIALQLQEPVRGVQACDSATAAATAAQAAMQVLSFLDEGPLPASVGGTLELAAPDWRWRRRSWQLHPDCGCAPADTR